MTQNTHQTEENWLFLYPYVHLNIKKNRAIIYNTLNGALLEYNHKPGSQRNGDPELFKLLKKLADDKNLYVIKVIRSQQSAGLNQFITDLRKTFSGDYMHTALSTKKPVQLKPRLRLQKSFQAMTFKSRLPLLLFDEIGQFLNEISLYINDECTQACHLCRDAFKQFPFCTADPQRKKRERITVEDIDKLLKQAALTNLYKINVLGGNILLHPQLPQIVERLNTTNIKKDYYLSYLNAATAPAQLKVIGNSDLNTLNILVHFPFIKETFKRAIAGTRDLHCAVTFHFAIENDGDVQLIDRLISAYQLEEFEYKPLYNGTNIAFFKENLFINREDISQSIPSQKDIYARMTLNTLDFKKLTLLSDKTAYANLNHKKIGTFGKDSVTELIGHELSRGTSWLRVRKHVTPCKGCVYNALCPPITNYEYAIGKYNLCHVDLV